MEKTTTVKYDDIEFDVVYALDEGCEGDLHTPPKQPEALITEVLIDDTNIFDIIDSDTIERWEQRILKEML
jgi:hypothetical protein